MFLFYQPKTHPQLMDVGTAEISGVREIPGNAEASLRLFPGYDGQTSSEKVMQIMLQTDAKENASLSFI